MGGMVLGRAGGVGAPGPREPGQQQAGGTWLLAGAGPALGRTQVMAGWRPPPPPPGSSERRTTWEGPGAAGEPRAPPALGLVLIPGAGLPGLPLGVPGLVCLSFR